MTLIDFSLLVQGLALLVIVFGILVVSALWQMRRDADRWHLTHNAHVQALKQRLDDQRSYFEGKLESIQEQLHGQEKEHPLE